MTEFNNTTNTNTMNYYNNTTTSGRESHIAYIKSEEYMNSNLDQSEKVVS